MNHTRQEWPDDPPPTSATKAQAKAFEHPPAAPTQPAAPATGPPPFERAAMTVTEAVDYLCITKTRFYDEVRAGRLRARKVGNRTILLKKDADEWLNNLELMNSEK